MGGALTATRRAAVCVLQLGANNVNVVLESKSSSSSLPEFTLANNAQKCFTYCAADPCWTSCVQHPVSRAALSAGRERKGICAPRSCSG